MGFPGKDRMQNDANATGSGGWVKLQDDVPQKVTILEYVGTTTSKKYPDKIQYRFQAVVEGVVKKLDANWKLMKALMDQIEQLDSAFEVTVTQRKVIAEITDASGAKSKKLVNDYTLDGVKAVDSTEIPF